VIVKELLNTIPITLSTNFGIFKATDMFGDILLYAVVRLICGYVIEKPLFEILCLPNIVASPFLTLELNP